MDSHTDTCVVGSNILVVHNHERFVDVYGFYKAAKHSNACTVDSAIAYKDPIMHSTVILMINQTIKIDNMTNILMCPMQCCVHGTIVNKRPKFLSASTTEDNHALLVHDPYSCSPPPPFYCPWKALLVTLRLDAQDSLSMKTKTSL